MAIHKELSRTRIGVQSSLDAAASNMIDIEVVGDANVLGESRTNTAPNNAQRRRRRDFTTPIHLQKSGSPVKLTAYLKGLASVLGASASPVAFSNASALSHQILYRAAFGAELTPAAGSTVASSSGTPVDHIVVASGHGSRFVVGQIVAIERSGAAPWVRRVTAISTDTLTISPPLGPAESPDTSAVVRNLYQYYPGETDSTVFTVEHAYRETGTPITQMRALAVHGQAKITTEINAVGQVEFSGESVSHTTPGDLSLSTNPVADDMGSPLVWQPVLWWTAFGAAAPSVADLSKVAFTVPRKWQKVPGAVLEGVGAVHEVAGRGEPIELECEGLFDDEAWSEFANGTERALVAYTVVGSGSDARIAGFWCPRVQVVESPKITYMDALVSASFKVRALMATDISGATPSLSTAEIRTANIIWFVG